MNTNFFDTEFEKCRFELLSYVTRMVRLVHIAEELVQETALRMIENMSKAPDTNDELRAWLFRIATNLSIDYLRKKNPVSETVLTDARKIAESKPRFLELAQTLHGDPQMAYIAREHLVACFSCVLGRFPPEQAAALLLREVYDFKTQEIAEILNATFGQVKNWLQTCRTELTEIYKTTCALINKKGVCYQCVELDSFYNETQNNPLVNTKGELDDRVSILRETRLLPIGKWPKMLSELLAEL